MRTGKEKEEGERFIRRLSSTGLGYLGSHELLPAAARRGGGEADCEGKYSN